MDDRTHADVVAARRYVTEAIASLGTRAYGVSPAELSGMVTDQALLIRRQCNERSLAMRTLTATPIVCTISSLEAEAKTQRIVVTFTPANGDGTPETIRTDRLDGALGPIVRKMWQRSLVGHRAIIYKHNDAPREGDRNAQGYRVACWVTDLGLGR